MTLSKLTTSKAIAASILAICCGSLRVTAQTAEYATPQFDPGTGDFYQLYLDPTVDWNNANAGAEASSYLGLQGHLATITSAGENNFVESLVNNSPDLSGVEVYIGGVQVPITETDPSVGWTWVNNEGTFPGVNGQGGFDQTYSNWNPGEPNDAQGPASEQWLGFNKGGQGGWNDEGNLGLIGGYVVEYGPEPFSAPEGGSLAWPFGLTLGALALARRRLAAQA